MCLPNTTLDTWEGLRDSERAEQFLLEKNRLPTFGGRWKEVGSLEEHTACETHIMKAGDAQYLPRAVLHTAEAIPCDDSSSEEAVVGLPAASSVHLTAGLRRKTAEWVHLLESAAWKLNLYEDKDISDLLAIAKSLAPWRRQMPTWALRDEPDEVLDDWRNKLRLLLEHARHTLTSASLEWIESLHNRSALHGAILMWQRKQQAEEDEDSPISGHVHGRKLYCGDYTTCAAGEYGTAYAYE